MARALITGIAGQDGSYLAERLLADGYDVVGFDLAASASEARNLVGIADQIEYIAGDLLQVGSLRGAIADSEADQIYHLAAPTFVPDSWEDPSSTMAAIVGSTSEILAAALEATRVALDLKNDVRATNTAGETALHAAALAGLDSVVKLLVDRGAPVNAKTKAGKTPLATAEGTVVAMQLVVRANTAKLLKSLGGVTQ